MSLITRQRINMRKKLFKCLSVAFLSMALLANAAPPYASAANNTITNSDSSDTENYGKDTVSGGSTEITGSFDTTSSVPGTVNGVTQISVTVPASVTFTVDGSSENQITAAELNIKNTGNSPVLVKLADFKKTVGDYEIVSNPASVSNWNRLSHSDRKISLGISKPANSGFNSESNAADNAAGSVIWANSTGNQNVTLGVLSAQSDGNDTGKLVLSAYHGTSFTSSEVGLNLGSYQISWNISLY